MANRLLWLDLNCSYSHSSLALPAIHAQGEGGAQWSVVSGTTSTNLGDTVSQVVAQSPDIIAATVWLFNRDYLLRIVERVKALLPHCTVILGGPEFLGENETFLRTNPHIDCVFRGEGEEQFSRWLTTPKERWGEIVGLCFIDNQGSYIDGGRAQVTDFEQLASPESSRFFNWDKAFVQLETTRGCFNSCAFCVSGNEKPIRQIPLDRVEVRLANIQSRGIREVRLLDRTFNGDSRRAVALLGLFAKFADMRFHLEIHPALLPPELRTALAALPDGLLHLEAGIQSLRQEVLDASGRAGSVEKSMDGLRFLTSLSNIITHADLIAGLPHYTLAQIFSDIRTLAAMGAEEIQLETLKLLPGTAMRRDAAKLGIIYAPSVPYEVLRTESISVDELVTARLLSRLIDFYYNTAAWQAITQKLIVQDENFTENFLTWLSRGDYLDQPLSIEKRGLLLFEYIYTHTPQYVADIEHAWVAAKLSIRKVESLKKNISL